MITEITDKEKFENAKKSFADIVTDLQIELTNCRKEVIALQNQLRIAVLSQQIGKCGRCEQDKNLPYRSDDYGYVCVGCALCGYNHSKQEFIMKWNYGQSQCGFDDILSIIDFLKDELPSIISHTKVSVVI